VRIDIISDIHLDFFKDSGEDFIRTWVPEGEVLILAGDAGEYSWWKNKGRLMDALCRKYGHVLYIAGNHDYYGSSLEEGDACFREVEDRIQNLHFLERETLEFGGVKFAGCSLWFKDDPMGVFYEKMMSDFSNIRDFKPWIYHRNALSQTFLKELQDIDVVITHHMPTQLSVHERYVNDPCNRFFLCEMDNVILDLQPKFWIHGHTHLPCNYSLGNTRVVCNPLGYPNENPGPYGPVTIEV